MSDVKDWRLAKQVRSIFKTCQLSEVEIEEFKRKLRQQRLELDHTILANQAEVIYRK